MVHLMGAGQSGETWTEQQKIVASERAVDDRFGYSVSISGDYAIVGVYGEDQDASGGNIMSNAGSAYVFVRSGETWTEQQKIVASKDLEEIIRSERTFRQRGRIHFSCQVFILDLSSGSGRGCELSAK